MVERGVVLVNLVEGVPAVVGVPDGAVGVPGSVVESVVVGEVVAISSVMRIEENNLLLILYNTKYKIKQIVYFKL